MATSDEAFARTRFECPAPWESDEGGLQAAVLDSLSECVTVVDDLGVIVYANRAAHALFGYAGGALVGRAVATLSGDVAGQRVPSIVALRDASLRNGRWDGEMLARRHDGTTFPMQVAVTPFVHEGRHWWITVRRDVSERRHLGIAALEAAHEERHRVATELHECLGQVLAGVGMSLAGLRRELGGASPETARKLTTIIDGLHDATVSCRSYAEDLTLSTLGRDGLKNGLLHAALRAEIEHAVPCHVDVDADVAQAIAPTVATELCRIAQEALLNAGRHARPAALWLTLRGDGDGAEMCVADDGCGFEPERASARGQGLRLMRFRANQIGGRLEVQSTIGSGTRVACRLAYSGT